jgi:hypothetical protein
MTIARASARARHPSVFTNVLLRTVSPVTYCFPGYVLFPEKKIGVTYCFPKSRFFSVLTISQVAIFSFENILL